MKRMMKVFVIASVISASVVVAQEPTQPWPKWSEKDAKKILENSPWAQTQVQTNTPEMFPNAGQRVINPDTGIAGASGNPDQLPGNNPDNSVNYYIRFLSAKPIRQAFARLAELRQKNADPQMLNGLRDLVERKFDQWIVVAVAFESKNQRFSGPVMYMFNGATFGTLRNSAFLELNNGKRLFLADYQAPSSDGLGAKFIFPRTVDGMPFITAENGKVRFIARITSSEASTPLFLNMQFKVADFKYEGVLEY
jgi:hypothetical protein